MRAYFRRLIRWRVGVGWYVVALLAPVAAWAIVAYVNVLFGAAPPSPDQLAGWSLIITSTLIFLINPFGGAFEEPGWRGYALPLLLRRHSALVASAVLGVMWTLWHLPLFVVGFIPWPDAVTDLRPELRVHCDLPPHGGQRPDRLSPPRLTQRRGRVLRRAVRRR